MKNIPSRAELRPYLNQTVECIGQISDYGMVKFGFDMVNPILGEKTILLTNIFEPRGRFYVDHVWIPWTSQFEHFKIGDYIQFEGTVSEYWKKHSRKNHACEHVLEIGFEDLRQIKRVKHPKIVM